MLERLDHPLAEYIGQEPALDIIRLALVNQRDSAMLNIIGPYGSGRSSLLSFIAAQLETRGWRLPPSAPPVPILVQGMSYSVGDRFIPFLTRQIRHQLEQKVQVSADPDFDLADCLNSVAAQDVPIIIMIDNFSRIMERLESDEVEGLNRLRPAGVHYILATDHRGLSEISKPIYEGSEFFKDARPVHLTPLNPDESKRLVSTTASSSHLPGTCELEALHVDRTIELAGGHPGLLDAATRSLCFAVHKISSPSSPARHEDFKWSAFYRKLIEDDRVRYYLSRLVDSVKGALSLPEQVYLLGIAVQEADAPERLTVIDEKLRKFWLLDSNTISGRLLQFGLLDELSPIKLSQPESAVFDILKTSRPGLVPFEHIFAAVYPEARPSEREKSFTSSRSQRVQSIVARVKAKVSKLPNQAAFTITNERQRGYFVRSEAPFDKFMAMGPQTFQGEDGP